MRFEFDVPFARRKRVRCLPKSAPSGYWRRILRRRSSSQSPVVCAARRRRHGSAVVLLITEIGGAIGTAIGIPFGVDHQKVRV